MPASARPRSSSLSVPDSLLKGTTNEKLVRHVRALNPTAKIIATADVLSRRRRSLCRRRRLRHGGAAQRRAASSSTVIEAADAGLLDDKRAEIDARLSRAPGSAAVKIIVVIVARMQRSEIRDCSNQKGLFTDCAALHPADVTAYRLFLTPARSGGVSRPHAHHRKCLHFGRTQARLGMVEEYGRAVRGKSHVPEEGE